MGHFSDGRPLMIYFIREEGSDYVKIGRTRMPGDRLRELQVSNPRKLRIVKLFKAPPKAEPILHTLFREERVRGEWFKISQRMSQFIGEDDEQIIGVIKLAKKIAGKKNISKCDFEFVEGYGEKVAS